MAQAMLDFHEFSLVQSQNQSIPEQEQKDIETLLSTFTEGIESQQDQNFSQGDNEVPRKKRRRSSTTNCSNTKVKARNLLTNVSYRRFIQSDFNTSSFTVDILSFLVQLIWTESWLMRIKRNVKICMGRMYTKCFY